MTNKNHIRPLAFLLGLALYATNIASYAGSVDELKHEISFLAKKLLDQSGKDTITIKQAAAMKPFIGVCPEPSARGIKLTCITPGHNAAKAGLQTGDLVIAIDRLSMVSNESDKKHHHSAYRRVFSSLNTGKTLLFTVLRGSEEMKINVTVGAISHPAYTMTVSKDQIPESGD